MVILENLVDVVALFVVKDDAKDSEKDSLTNFQYDIQRLSELIHPVSFEDSSELSAPACLYFIIYYDTFVEVGFG